jgi:sigma-B regulation protein RsbU (phosphoserine phosphatase)
VGGDFYDAFETEEGKWALVLGDVMGKGPRAAALTGLARHTLRAVTTTGRSPSDVLQRLNDAILKQDEATTQFATVALAFVSRDGDKGKVVVSSGGHHLPIVLRENGTVERAGTPGMVLGAFDDPELSDTELELEPCDTIIFFTDGVIEEGEGDRTFGEGNLLQVVQAEAGGSPTEIAEAIEQAVASFRPEEPRDDIAILALRMSGDGENESASSLAAERS